MANKNTTALTAASTPLDGTELIHIIQSGNSRKVASEDLANAPHNQFLVGFVPGLPADGGLIAQVVMAETRYLPAGATNSQGYATTAPTVAAADFDIQKNGVSVGTMSFAIASNTSTFTVASKTTLVAGDRLAIVAPSPQNAALADTSFNIILNGS